MTDLEKIATDCRDAADYYADKPGHAGAETIIDLYRAVQRLAEATERRMRQIDNASKLVSQKAV